MASTEQKKRLLKAKIAVALQDELGRVPKEAEINPTTLLNGISHRGVFSCARDRRGDDAVACPL